MTSLPKCFLSSPLNRCTTSKTRSFSSRPSRPTVPRSQPPCPASSVIFKWGARAQLKVFLAGRHTAGRQVFALLLKIILRQPSAEFPFRRLFANRGHQPEWILFEADGESGYVLGLEDDPRHADHGLSNANAHQQRVSHLDSSSRERRR